MSTESDRTLNARASSRISPEGRVKLAAGLALLLSIAPVTWLHGQLIVFDPSTYEEAIQQLVELQRQFTQLASTYRLLVEQAASLPGDLSARYRGTPTPWLDLTAPDTYSRLGGWLSTANTGGNVEAGYQVATEPLVPYGAATLAQMPSDEVPRVETSFSTVELSDGVNTDALEMLGYLRSHSVEVELALRRLEDDSFSSDPAFNTQVAVLNKINAAAVTSARLTKDTNQIVIAILEELLTDAKRQRDAEAVAIDAHVRFETEARDLLQRTSAGTTEALTAFRLP